MEIFEEVRDPQSNDNPDKENPDKAKTKDNLYRFLLHAFKLVISCIYTGLFMMAYYNTNNIYHIASWIATFSSISFILFYINILLFGTNLCSYQIHYELLNKIQYIPYNITLEQNIPWTSLSMIAYANGSTVHKYHTLLVNTGSFAIVYGSMTKLFALRENVYQYKLHEIIAIWFLFLGGIGGIIHGNIEIASQINNKLKCYVHYLGVFLYAIIGNIACVLYNDMDWISCILFGSTVVWLAIYQAISSCLLRKTKKGDKDWVNNVSKIHLFLELVGITPSAIAMCLMIYEYGSM